MTCEMCKRGGREFILPGPDHISMALMAEHLAEAHGITGPKMRLAEWNRRHSQAAAAGGA